MAASSSNLRRHFSQDYWLNGGCLSTLSKELLLLWLSTPGVLGVSSHVEYSALKNVGIKYSPLWNKLPQHMRIIYPAFVALKTGNKIADRKHLVNLHGPAIQ